MQELAAAAREHGIVRFVARVQPDNAAMKALVLELDPLARAHHEDGVVVYDFAVPGSLSLPSAGRPVRRPGAVESFLGRCAEGLRQLLPGRMPGGVVTQS
jgi:hypothetical protein